MVLFRRATKPIVTSRGMWSRRLLLLVVASVAAVSSATATKASELTEQAHSLRLVPADAAFYSVSLRLREQLDNFLASNTYHKLLEIPVLQIAKMQVEIQWEQAAIPQVAMLKDYISSPEGSETVAVLKEMFSDEIFMYGGGDIAASLKLFMELNGIQRTARFEALASGEEPEAVMARRVTEVLTENAEDFNVPSIVTGWRIKNAEPAERKLDEVHSLVRHFLDEHHPEFSAHLQREQIAGHEFLTLRLDGSMIPWDQIRDEATDADPQQIDQWQELFSSKTIALALGIVDEFVLLSVGDSTDHLESFGRGESIVEQPAVKRLAKHADERVVSMSYISKNFLQQASSPKQTVEDLTGAAEEILHAAEVSDEQRTRLLDDIRGLANELKEYMPEAGAMAVVTFLSNRGYEAFQYNFGSRPTADSSQPLTILNHAGGTPMLVVAGRSKEDPENYERVVEWLKRIATKVEEIAKSKVEPEQWAHYLTFRDRGVELLRRLDRVNRQHLTPALQDGQWAVVMDSTATSQRWVDAMPESPKPLPMLEFALVVSVSDAEHLRQGVAELFDIVHDTIELVRNIHPEDVAEVELPESEVRELDAGGTMYVYPLPEAWGVDEQVAPNAGLNESVAVASTFPATTERLLREQPFNVDSGIALDRPAAMASRVEFAKGVAMIRPWIDYGFDVAIGKLKVEDEDGEEDVDDGDEEVDVEAQQQRAAVAMQAGMFMPQLHQFLEVTTALQSASSVMYEEDGVWVTHSETHLEDLEETEVGRSSR